MEQNQHCFHLEEYKQIRAEGASLVARVESLFRYSLVVAATVYAWLFVQMKSYFCGAAAATADLILLRSAWWLPPSFVLFAALLALVSYWHLSRMGNYLQKVETLLGSPDLGWQADLKQREPVVTAVTIAMWLLLLIVALATSKAGSNVVVEQQAKGCSSSIPAR